MVRDLVVDTDIKGLNDDAFALHYLIGVGRIPSLVTTVFGNTSPGQSATDARALLQNACGFGAPPVIEGASRPLGWTADRRSQRERLLASLPHDTYLAGLAPSGPLFIGQPEVSGTSQATQALVDHLGSSDASDVLALGPLTNIAEACERLPHAVLAKHRLWVCGGALETGNVTGATEFNAFADSLGLSIALAAPWDKVTLVPLDVTGTVHFGRADVERLLATGSAFGIELS